MCVRRSLGRQSDLLPAKAAVLAFQACSLDAEAVASQVTDVLWCAWQQGSTRPALTLPPPGLCNPRLLSVKFESPDTATQRLRLADVARAALAAEVVSRRMLLERSEGEFLELIELIPSADTFKKKEVRVALSHSARGWSHTLSRLRRARPGARQHQARL
jgi:hypothetical protein